MKNLKKKLNRDETLLGCWLNLGSSLTAEIIGLAGFDWILIDLEHGSGTENYMQLLGGKFRDEVRIYLDCHAENTLESLDTLLQPCTPKWMRTTNITEPSSDNSIFSLVKLRARQMAGLGYTALKFDLDLPDSTFHNAQGYNIRSEDIDWMVNMVQAAREGAGDHVDIAFDAHWRYKAHEIITVLKEIEPFRIMWIEDSLPPYDLMGLEHIRKLTGIPVATGENLQLQQGFKPLIDRNLCDVVTPDLQKAGGLLEGKKIADMSNVANKLFAPHMIGGPLALLASGHLSVAVPNFLACEFHAHDVPFFHDLVEGGPGDWFKPGWIKPPDKPGFGIELDEKVVSEYLHPQSSLFKR